MSVYTEIDDKLFSELRNLVGEQQLNLFTQKGELTEVFQGSSFRFLVPVGFFAASRYPPRGRRFRRPANPMPDAEKVSVPELYPVQRRVVEEVEAAAKRKAREGRPPYVTLHLACGFGKTVTACHLIAKHRLRAVVCVPNKMIIPQWRAAVEATGASHLVSVDGVSSLLRELRTVTPSVLVVVSRHFGNEEFCRLVDERYDVLVVDESHTHNLMNNTAMARFLAFHPPRVCYFLTATPRAVNRVYCNDVINVTKLSTLRKTLRVSNAYFEPFSTPRVRAIVRMLDSPQNKYHIYTEKALVEDAPRNAEIVRTVADEFAAGAINRVLVIAKLRSHMLAIYNALVERFGEDVVALGDAQNRKTPERVRDIRGRARFIFVSTLFYSGTGLDIPSLDSLVVCVGVMNAMQAEQLLGRVCRDTADHANRTVFVFPTTAIREIRSVVGLFAQRLVALATQKLGFERDAGPPDPRARTEKALARAFRR
ncbi:transcript release/DNA helicase [Squirrelpox virus]|uniref:Transcript release/DNA helicase n=1 Tax=Squirrelpox virus TaxID=240426 RepID=U3UBM1_9POXV|nr:transcript release/DNA helicase [Squirrelpox virus]CCD83290.1 transcript release/DNA helicase [Squirrelpox virus]